VPPSFAKAASIEALQTDKDALGIVLDVSSAVASMKTADLAIEAEGAFLSERQQSPAADGGVQRTGGPVAMALAVPTSALTERRASSSCLIYTLWV